VARSNARAPKRREPPTSVIADSNQFHRDAHASRELMTALLVGAPMGNYEVVVPEVVIHELAKQFGPRLSKAVLDANEAIGRMNRELVSFGVRGPETIDVDVTGQVAEY